MASGTESLGHHGTQRSKQLEFGKAMSDFTSMFPSVDYEVIEMVLRANNGLVDATVDQLLAMQEETNQTENKIVDPDLNVRLPGYNDSSSLPTNEPPPAYTPRVEDDTHFWYDSTFLKQQTGSFSSSTSSQNTPASSEMKNWNPPLLGNLPNDFLRISLNDTRNRTRTPPFNNSSREEVESRSRNHENVSREFIPWPSGTSTQTPNAVIQVGNRNPSSVTARPSTVNGFDAIPDSESTTPKRSEHKSKSKRFGQMSRKFKRKKTKSPKNNYQPISSANLIDEDSGEERDVQR